jgi:hypothetical protein
MLILLQTSVMIKSLKVICNILLNQGPISVTCANGLSVN